MMLYYKKAKLYAIICALLVLIAAALTLTIGLEAKAPFIDTTILSVKCVDVPFDLSNLNAQLASATNLPYTVTPGKDISGTYEAASVTFNGTGFTSVNAQTLISTLGASYSVLSLNTVAGKSTSGLGMYLVFVGIATLLTAGIYMAFRYGFKTAVSALVPALGAVGATLIVSIVIGTGLSYALAVALVGTLAVSLFFSALAFGQARELHEVKHVRDHDDVADRTGALLMPRNIKIALFAIIILGVVGIAGFIFNAPELTYTSIPLLVGTLIGLFGAQLCAVPLCMMWQVEATEALLKKKHERKPTKSTAKSNAKTPVKKAPTKKNIKKLDPAKPAKPKPKK